MAGKREIADRIRTGSAYWMSREVAEETVGAVLDAILQLTAEGENVSLHGFGLFKRVERPARQGVNPNTGDTIEVPARTVLTFKPSKATETT
jgi:DNA-binding protein HU-beta